MNSILQIEPRNTKKKAGTLHNNLKKDGRKNRLTRRSQVRPLMAGQTITVKWKEQIQKHEVTQDT